MQYILAEMLEYDIGNNTDHFYSFINNNVSQT